MHSLRLARFVHKGRRRSSRQRGEATTMAAWISRGSPSTGTTRHGPQCASESRGTDSRRRSSRGRRWHPSWRRRGTATGGRAIPRSSGRPSISVRRTSRTPSPSTVWSPTPRGTTTSALWGGCSWRADQRRVPTRVRSTFTGLLVPSSTPSAVRFSTYRARSRSAAIASSADPAASRASSRRSSEHASTFRPRVAASRPPRASPASIRRRLRTWAGPTTQLGVRDER